MFCESVKFKEVKLPTKSIQDIFITRNLHHNRSFISNITMKF